MNGYEITGQELLQYAGSRGLPYPARSKEEALIAIGAFVGEMPIVPHKIIVGGSSNYLKVDVTYKVPTRKDHALLGPENRLADKSTGHIRKALKVKNGLFKSNLELPPLEEIAKKGTPEKSN